MTKFLVAQNHQLSSFLGTAERFGKATVAEVLRNGTIARRGGHS